MRCKVRTVLDLRALIGLHVDIIWTVAHSATGACGLLVGVTETPRGDVYADFADGLSLPLAFSGLSVRVGNPRPEDVTTFRESIAAGYYPNLLMNERLMSLVEAQ